jgi:DNA polymerase IV
MGHDKLHSPRHDDERPPRPALTAAPGQAHDARRHSVTNQMAPVATERAAVKANEEHSMGEVTAGTGIAGMAEASGVTRPGVVSSDAQGGAGDSTAPHGDASGLRAAMEGGALPAARSERGTTRAPSAASWSVAASSARAPASDTPDPPDPKRVILHVDIDAFFAAIEQQRDPRLRGRPVIVGAGVIASCSYEARRFGLHAGMPLSEARRLCPDAVIIDGHAQVYRCFAEDIFERCRAISPAVETFLDEAYCDLSGTDRLHGDLFALALRLKDDIRAATGLTVTCGLGPNRMLAKLIGKTAKPDGLARIAPEDADAFLAGRPIEQLAGVGRAHAHTLRSMNIRTIGALRVLSADALAALFGAPGRLLHERCRGRDTAAVVEREVPLSISRETSFHRDTADRAEHEGMLEYLVGRACRTARELGIRPRTVAVRLRYSGGDGDERARSLKIPTHNDPVVLELALDLLRRLFTRRAALHALGVTLSNFVRAEGEQGSLFDEREAGRRAALYEAFDGVRRSYGHGVLVSGRALHLRGRLQEDQHGFVLRTSSLTK